MFTETLYPLALFSARARLLLVPAGIGFLIGIRLLMGPTFEALVICNVFWVPWTIVLAWMRAHASARSSRVALPPRASGPTAGPDTVALP